MKTTIIAAAIVLLTAPASYADTIAITEFLNNPGVFEQTEWVELYNYSASAVDLSGWSIHDELGDFAPLPGIVLPSGSYLILTGSRTDFLAHWFGGVDSGFVHELASSFGLANTSDQLILLDALAQVEWNLAWTNDEDSGRATFLTGSDFAVSDFGTAASPGISRSGDDNGIPGFLGYQQNNFTLDPFAFSSTVGDVGSPLAGSYTAVPEPSTLALMALGLFVCSLAGPLRPAEEAVWPRLKSPNPQPAPSP